MDLSLDELIKSKRSSSRGGRRGGGRQGGSRGGGSRGSGIKRGGGGGSNFRSNGAAGGGPIRRGRPMARRSNGFSPYSKGDVNGSWTHDMFDGPKRQQQIRGGLSTTNIHKIVISNLDFGVTSTDIQASSADCSLKIPR